MCRLQRSAQRSYTRKRTRANPQVFPIRPYFPCYRLYEKVRRRLYLLVVYPSPRQVRERQLNNITVHTILICHVRALRRTDASESNVLLNTSAAYIQLCASQLARITGVSVSAIRTYTVAACGSHCDYQRERIKIARKRRRAGGPYIPSYTDVDLTTDP